MNNKIEKTEEKRFVDNLLYNMRILKKINKRMNTFNVAYYKFHYLLTLFDSNRINSLKVFKHDIDMIEEYRIFINVIIQKCENDLKSSKKSMNSPDTEMYVLIMDMLSNMYEELIISMQDIYKKFDLNNNGIIYYPNKEDKIPVYKEIIEACMKEIGRSDKDEIKTFKKRI